MTIDFNPETHEYKVEGEVWPSVTRLMKECGFIDDSFYTEAGADRGSAVHEAVALIEQKLVAPAMYADNGYVQAYLAAKAELRIGVEAVETPVAELRYRYCGTPDLLGPMRLWKDEGGDIELKTGAVQAWWGIQGAAYRLAHGLKHVVFLELRADGKYRLHTSYRDEPFDSRWWTMCWVSGLQMLEYQRRWS